VKYSLIALIVIITIVLFAAGGSNIFTPRITTTSEFIISLDPGKQFYDMSYAAAQDAPDYHRIVAKIGKSEADRLFEKHLLQSIEQREIEWGQNLQESYLHYFSEEELLSLVNERRDSPFAEKFREKHTVVGNFMKELSANLLIETLTEALENALKEI
jgi:hypothetical protein